MRKHPLSVRECREVSVVGLRGNWGESVLREYRSNFRGKYLGINCQISKTEGRDVAELHAFSQQW